MGWRAAKAQMAAGTYDAPGDQEGAGFAQGFASTFVPAFTTAVQSYADEQREKRMLELKESLYRQRPRSSSTAAADRKAADELKEIAALADELGIPNTEAASIYYANDKNSNRASEQWRSDRQGGLIVEPVVPSSPVQDEIVPEETDDLSSTEPSVNDGTVVETSEAVVAPTVETPVAETATTAEDQTQAALEEPQQTPTGSAAFEPFQVASVGSIQDDLSLLTGTEEETADAPVRIAEAIDQEIEVAQATGQDVSVTYQDGLQAGATPTENLNILAAGTRIPEVYRIPEVSKITTLAEATAALDVLDARQGFIGGRDRYDINVRPMLEARVRSLTELPDLGQMLQDNQADRLREFYEFGYRQFESKVDPAQLEAHRQRAGELLNSVTSYPPIPSDLGELQALRNRVSAGEFPQAPTEWLETLNTNVRAAELQQRYGDRLTVDYIMSDERSERELTIMRDAVISAMGRNHPLVTDLNLALGTPVAEELPKIADVRSENWRSMRDAAAAAGDTALSQSIARLGQEYEDAAEQGVNIADVRAENWRSLRDAAIEAGDQDLADRITRLGAEYEATEMPNIADVRAENWRSLRDAARRGGDEELAKSIETLGAEYEAAKNNNDNDRVERLAEVSSVLARANTQISDTNAQADAYIGAVDSAYRLNAILQQNRNINYFFGGSLPAAIMNAVGEISAVRSLVNGNDVNINDAITSVDNFERTIEEQWLSGSISEDARAYAMYQAQETRLAFQLARLQQGPAGVISNQDFESARDQVRASRNPDTFEAAIRGLVGAEEIKVATAVDGLLNNPQIQIAQQLQEGLGIDFTNGALRTIEQRVTDVGAQDAYAWVRGGPAIAPSEDPPQVTVPQAAIDFLNSNDTPENRAFFSQKYGVSADQYITGGGN